MERGPCCATSIRAPTSRSYSSASRDPTAGVPLRNRKTSSSLREEGVLIVGSGNVVHNLHAYAWGQRAIEPYEWAISFEWRVRELLLSGETAPLVDYEKKLGRDALLAAPTPDHYLPLLYVIGSRAAAELVAFPVEGVDGGSISMLTVQIG